LPAPDNVAKKTFDVLEWLDAMCARVPNKGEQMVRYYGYCSNICRDKRKKASEDGLVLFILHHAGLFKGHRKDWTSLFQWICASAMDFNN